MPARPKNLAIYYGWLNSFNSDTNQWNNEKVAQEFAKYDQVVFGDGVQDPGHGDYANTSVIIPRIKVLNPNCEIFGYVTINQDLGAFQTKASQWDDLSIDGIFLDEAGYDYGRTRDEFNTRVAYVKSQSSASLCFANSWNIDHVIGVVNDSLYPNSTYNADENASLLTSDDYYLLESFAVNTDAYTGNNGYASKTDWVARGEKSIARRATFGIKLASCGIIGDSDTAGQTKFDFAYHSAIAYAFESNGTSDTSYGASSAKTKFWTRPNPSQIGTLRGIPSVTADAGDADVYMRYGLKSRVIVDHSVGAQISSIEIW